MKPTANKKRFALVGGIASVALLAGGTVAVLNNDAKPAPKAESAQPVPTPKTYPAPVNLEYWQDEKWGGPNESEITKAVRDHVNEQLQGTNFEKTTNATIPAEDAGFTSDMGESGTKNGGINPFFSYWTDQTFMAQSHLLLEVFINPLYGGWAAGQAPGAAANITDGDFAGVFTESYLRRGAQFPVMADWKGNSYGEPDIVEAGGAYWFGEVESYDADWKWDDKSMGYRVVGTYKVVYKARLSDGSVVSKDGVLRLTFVPASTTVADSGGFRVQVDEASLRMGS